MRDVNPEDLERIIKEGEQSISRLAGMAEELSSITGTGESRGGLVEATVDNGGRLDRIELDPRTIRLGRAELGEQIVEAVRAAQDSAQHQAEELVAEAMGGQAPGVPMDLEDLQRQAQEIQQSLAMAMDRSLGTVDRLSRQSDW